MANFVKFKTGTSETIVNVDKVIQITSSGPTKTTLIVEELAGGLSVNHSIEEVRVLICTGMKNSGWH